VNERILKSLMEGISDLAIEPGVGSGVTFTYYDKKQKFLIVLARGEELDVRRRVIDDLRAELEQIAVQGLVQIQIKEHSPSPGAPSSASVFVIVDVDSNPPLLALFDIVAQRLTACLDELGPQRTARGRFGLLVLGIDGDRTRSAAVKEATDQMLARYSQLARSLSTSASSRLWVMFYDDRNKQFDEYAAACVRE